MNKEIKHFDKIVEVCFIILTTISLVIAALIFTNIIYSWTYDTINLNNLLVSTPFTAFLWIVNLLVYIFGIFYIICAIKSKKERLIKIAFSIFSMLTTTVSSTLIINFIANLFGVF